ncbi:hypothetical protein BJV74DRAFT_55472 [Russula compacta]|nr:hypothetical protein BJV74DRAFT_55472 [Russula compacta]
MNLSRHPYTLFRRAQSESTFALPVRAPEVFPAEDSDSHSPLMESDHDSVPEVISFTASLSDKYDASPPAAAPARAYPYVKHGSGITVILSGHRAGTSLPLHPSGSTLSGMVVLAKAANVASLNVKLEGSVSVREIQGGGRSTVVFFSDQLMTWSSDTAHLPDEFSFRRVMPAFSDDGRLLPPTFDSRLSAIPGFRVSINWAIVVTATRSRTNPFSLFRRTTRLSVPFGYFPRTRPPLRGPFPVATQSSPAQPRTSFVDLVPTRREHTLPIHTQIYLPHSQITSLTEAIPFRITLSAPDLYLKPFIATRSHPSFLPLGAAAMPATNARPGPVSVQLVRRIGADPRETRVVVVGKLATSATRGTVVADGVLCKAEIGQGSVSWWGGVRVPHHDGASAGGFVADRLVVQDVLVLTLNLPNMHTHAFPFKQVVPMQLTTDSPETNEAVPVTVV